MRHLLTALRAAAEITRLRILSVLRDSELTVSELVQILDQSQPRVSRHLKLLCESGLLQRYQEGARVYHRIADSGENSRIARGILDMIDNNENAFHEIQLRLKNIKQKNAALAADYFDKNAGDWDSIRNLAIPDTYIERKLIECLNISKPELFLDLGTGTGRMLEIFSPHIVKGIGIDLSWEMLQVARSNLDSTGVKNCTVRQSDINELKISDNSVDVISIHQVLHYLERPDQVISESSRVLKSGGQLIIVDFLPHDLEFLRENHAHRRLGISHNAIQLWAEKCDLKLTSMDQLGANKPNQKNQLTVGLWTLTK